MLLGLLESVPYENHAIFLPLTNLCMYLKLYSNKSGSIFILSQLAIIFGKKKSFYLTPKYLK